MYANLISLQPLDFQTYSVWAKPEQMLSMVKARLANTSLAAKNDLDLKLGSWNMEYMWQAKAEHFLETYKEIVSRHHLLAVQEITKTGLATIARACNYDFYASQANSRGQAVGFLIHPRFQVQNIHEYPQLMNAYRVPDLRPALQIDLFDCQSQLKISVVTLHLKSMLGGINFTSRVRKEQLQQLLIALPDNINPIIIVGDFNCFLDTANDFDCLISDGYKLVNPHNHTSTQSSGGRLDGLFCKNLPGNLKPGHYAIHNFWRSSLVGRTLSDHGLLSWKLMKQEMK